MNISVFECKRCNKCCTGEGGIFFKKKEIPIAASLLKLSPKKFIALYCEQQKTSFVVRCNKTGHCILLGAHGCIVHTAKPNVCRRWPFLKILLKDAGAFEEAKLVCPGLNPLATHTNFITAAHSKNFFI